MNVHLVVVRPFGTYRKGDTITDAKTVSQILASGNAHNVVRVTMQGG
jgi:hypothetical protein